MDPPEEARAHLDDALTALRGRPGEPRWIPPERWHLTLLFLGTVPADRVPPLLAAAAPAVAAAAAMSLRLAGGGRFGTPRRPQVMWVGLDGDVRPLTDLARGLADVAHALDLPVEDRPFRAHLTVGRWRPRQPADGTLPGLLADYRGPAWPVTEVRLLESHLGPAPRYEAVAEWRR